MPRPRILRLIRITWTAGCAVVCLLLIVLAVRSYYFLDEFSQSITGRNWVGVSSVQGQLQFYTGQVLIPSLHKSGWKSYDAQRGYGLSVVQESAWAFYFGGSYDWLLHLPHWFLAFVCASLAAAPWIPWRNRFSLKTLLLTITLLALVLGTAVYYMNQQIVSPPIDHGDFGTPMGPVR